MSSASCPAVIFVDKVEMVDAVRGALDLAQPMLSHVAVDMEWHAPDDVVQVQGPNMRPGLLQIAVQQSQLPEDARELLRAAQGEPVKLPDGGLLVKGVVVLVFDLVTLPAEAVRRCVSPILSDRRVVKLCWDCREDSWVMKHKLGMEPSMAGVLDLQLLEVVSKEDPRLHNKSWVYCLGNLKGALENCPGLHHLVAVKKTACDGAKFVARPLDLVSLQYAAGDVAGFFVLYEQVTATLHRMFPREAESRLRDAFAGSEVYLTYADVVPPAARRHGRLPVGVLQTIDPAPSKCFICSTCCRWVKSKNNKSDTCRACSYAARRTTRHYDDHDDFFNYDSEDSYCGYDYD